jgi:hypothetical protein
MGFKAPELSQALQCAQDYIYKSIGRYRRIKKCRERVAEILGNLPEFYREVCRHRLPQLALAEGKALDLYCEEPARLIEKPTLARQIKISAGVSPEAEDGPSVINIGEIRNMMITLTNPEKLMPPGRRVVEVVNEDIVEEEE